MREDGWTLSAAQNLRRLEWLGRTVEPPQCALGSRVGHVSENIAPTVHLSAQKAQEHLEHGSSPWKICDKAAAAFHAKNGAWHEEGGSATSKDAAG